MKREIVQIEGTKVYKDLYLVERLFPTLIESLEELSREVELLMSEESN